MSRPDTGGGCTPVAPTAHPQKVVITVYLWILCIVENFGGYYGVRSRAQHKEQSIRSKLQDPLCLPSANPKMDQPIQ